MTKDLRLRLDEDTYQVLEQMAYNEQVSKSELVRYLINHYLVKKDVEINP